MKKRTKKQQKELEDGWKAYQEHSAKEKARLAELRKHFPNGVVKAMPGAPRHILDFDLKQADIELSRKGWTEAAQRLQDAEDKKEALKSKKQQAGKASGESRRPSYKELIISYKEEYLKAHKKLDNHIPDSRIIQQFTKDHPGCPSEKTLYRYLS